MNYTKIYNLIIEKRKVVIPTGYVEEHHIIPRSLGGSDDKSNLVKLTAKEHFICHLLLTKMYPNDTIEYYKMFHAFFMMLVTSKNQKRYITSRKYENMRVSFSERMSVLQGGNKNSQFGTMWIHNKTLKQCKKVPKDSILEEGWETGRVIDFNKKEVEKIKIIKKKENIISIKETNSNKNIECYTNLYEIYKTKGWAGIVETGYTKSKQNFVMRLSKYVVDFIPQNGKTRGLR